MRTMIRIIIAIPLLILLVLFALSNRQTVDLSFWPTDYVLVGVPLSVAILIGAAIAFFVGALIVWFALIGAKRRAARAERAQRMLEAQVRELKARAPRQGVVRTGTALTVSR